MKKAARKKGSVRIAIAQINPTLGDFTGNCRTIASYIGMAKRHKADIAVFPELAVCGYPPEDLLLKPHFIDDNIKAMRTVIRKTAGITTIAGFVHRDKKGNIYNAAAVMSNRKLKGVYCKRELPNYGVFDERRYFTAGLENTIFRLGDVKFGVTICEDIWKRAGAYTAQAGAGAGILINISASPYHAGKRNERERLLSKRAKRTGAFICYANMVGGQDELVFDGGSFILDPRGNMIASGREFGEDMVISDIDITDASTARKKTPVRDKVRTVTITRTSQRADRIPLPGIIHKKLTRLEEMYGALVLGTRDYVKKNGFKNVLIGLSGGIDSALTAAIASDAIGKNNVTAISMPSRYSSKGPRVDSRRLAKNLGIKLLEVPIERIFKEYLGSLSKSFKGTRPGVAEENIQARIRGNILMAFSNKFGSLVVTTGNKSETAVGYCTLYGDMAGGFAVIKDVPKTYVYKLCEFRNNAAGYGMIPRGMFTRPPSAELRKGQKDQDSLPPYGILDTVLKAYVENDKSIGRIRSQGIARRTIRDILRKVDSNEYKRRQAPPGIKITPKAFGKDRRLPITCRYEEK